MSTLTLALKRQSMNAKREPRSPAERFHFAALPWRSLMIVTLAALGMLYLVLVNQSATHGFALKDLQDRADKLNVENRKLELQATELQSMASISAAGQAFQLESTKTVRYLPTGSAVAAR